jgi:hypothetical protein
MAVTVGSLWDLIRDDICGRCRPLRILSGCQSPPCVPADRLTVAHIVSKSGGANVELMDRSSSQNQKTVEELAHRYGVSSDAVTTLFHAVMQGNGTMAQFSHPELGGPGQWSQGGMAMVGDMFNQALKAKVDGICSELSTLWSRGPSPTQPGSASSQTQNQRDEASSGEVSFFIPEKMDSLGGWWGAELGTAGSTGSQNEIRYAYFPGARRLAVGIGDQVTIYDTGDHAITGVSQQQSGSAFLTFVSQRGLVRASELSIVSQKGKRATGT